MTVQRYFQGNGRENTMGFKSVSYQLLIAFFVFTMSTYADVNSLLKKGHDQFMAGKAEEALDTFYQAFEEAPDNPDVNFMLGRAAFETRDFEAAAMAFERVLITNPEAVRAKLELARSYFNLGAFEMSRAHFLEVLGKNPPEKVRENISMFLEKIDEILEKMKPHQFSGSLTLGLTYDNNARASSDYTVVQTYQLGSSIIKDYSLDSDSNDTKGKAREWIYNQTLSLNHQYTFPDRRTSWFSGISLHNSYYDTEKDLDLHYGAVTTGLFHRFDKWSIGAIFNALRLRKDNDMYLESDGLIVPLSWYYSPTTTLNASFRIALNDYKQNQKQDAVNTIIGINPRWQFGANTLTCGLRWEHENATEEDEAYNRYVGEINYERILAPSLTFFGGYRYQHTNYIVRSPTDIQLRKDRLHEFKAGLRKQLNERSSLEFSHTFGNAHSTVNIYQYDHHATKLIYKLNF